MIISIISSSFETNEGMYRLSSRRARLSITRSPHSSPRSLSHRAEQQFETVTRPNASLGVEEQVQQVLYGGTRGGKPVGGARYYLGPEFTQG